MSLLAAVEAAATVEPCSLDECIATFQRWLHLPDPGVVLIALATVAANRMDGDPVWTLVVGPPGAGKSESINAVATLEDCHPAATMTEAALLSGTPKRDTAATAKGGLLRTIGEYGIITLKDFGSVLSMNRDARAAVLAALREIYDGRWTRHVGTDGGKTLDWSGKVGLLAGCTPAIDSHHAVMGSMGERFCIYRLPVIDADAQARRALTHVGRERAMRDELAAAVAALFVNVERTPRGLTDAESEHLIQLATLAVRCRSAIERDPRTREIELIPEPEAPSRLALVLARLLDGLTAIGARRPEAWRLVTKVALDSMPAVRRAVLEEVMKVDAPTTTPALAEKLGYPTTTTRRALEDLTAHGVLVRNSQGSGNADLWKATTWTSDRWRAIRSVPEMSGVEGS